MYTVFFFFIVVIKKLKKKKKQTDINVNGTDRYALSVDHRANNNNNNNTHNLYSNVYSVRVCVGGGENKCFIREYACRPPVNSAGRLFFIAPCSADGNNNHYYYYYCFMRPDRRASGVRITAGESSAHAYIYIYMYRHMYVRLL